jgi:hypothetical protein
MRVSRDGTSGARRETWHDKAGSTDGSRLARQAEELVRASSPPFLTNHCFRSHAWAFALAECDRVHCDAELLYVAALLHDLGLIAQFDTGRCFELDSAAAAAAGWSEERCDALAEAIRLHVALEEELRGGPGSLPALARHRSRRRRPPLRRARPPHDRARRCRLPPLDFKGGFTDLLLDQAGRKPGCWAANAIESGIAERIQASPLDAGGWHATVARDTRSGPGAGNQRLNEASNVSTSGSRSWPAPRSAAAGFARTSLLGAERAGFEPSIDGAPER